MKNRSSGKKLEVLPMEAKLSLCVVESVRLVEQSGGRNEAWCSAAVTGGKGVSLGPADVTEDTKIPSTGLVVVWKKLSL